MTRMTLKPALAALLFVMLILPAASMAAEGFYIGTGFGMSTSQEGGDLITDFDPDDGMALEFIHLGYNFNDRWGMSLQWGTAFGNSDEIQQGDTTDTLGDLYMLMLGSTFDWARWSQNSGR